MLMGHRTTHPMARSVARQLARHLTPTVAIETAVDPTRNSFIDNDLGAARGTIGSRPWVSASVATWVAAWAAREGGATPPGAPRFAPSAGPSGGAVGVAPPSSAGDSRRGQSLAGFQPSIRTASRRT